MMVCANLMSSEVSRSWSGRKAGVIGMYSAARLSGGIMCVGTPRIVIIGSWRALVER
jgi:hypothetical protein